ncbi:MAG: radical SAM protein [Gemmatimonadota bacterium]|nr:radical SAM protein [Gemmatimonadota bacterium]
MPDPDLAVAAPPSVHLTALDQLWFQVSGTVCNLRCQHCFISCAPDNHSLWFMSRVQVREALADSRALGVKEYYFTGGEPFMNKDIEGMLADTLELGPATVLTNATLLPPRRVEGLRRLAEASLYTLELRVSIDGVTPEMNDAIRGAGTFARALEGVGRLVGAGFLPIVTTMQSWPDRETDTILAAFREILANVGYERPRLKVLPPLLMGAEAERTRGYLPTERVTTEMLEGYDTGQLLCSRARLVTAQGVLPCPILADEPGSRLSARLADGAGLPVRLSEQACFTCYLNGAICSNVPGGTGDFG